MDSDSALRQRWRTVRAAIAFMTFQIFPRRGSLSWLVLHYAACVVPLEDLAAYITKQALSADSPFSSRENFVVRAIEERCSATGCHSMARDRILHCARCGNGYCSATCRAQDRFLHRAHCRVQEGGTAVRVQITQKSETEEMQTLPAAPTGFSQCGLSWPLAVLLGESLARLTQFGVLVTLFERRIVSSTCGVVWLCARDHNDPSVAVEPNNFAFMRQTSKSTSKVGRMTRHAFVALTLSDGGNVTVDLAPPLSCLPLPILIRAMVSPKRPRCPVYLRRFAYDVQECPASFLRPFEPAQPWQDAQFQADDALYQNACQLFVGALAGRTLFHLAQHVPWVRSALLPWEFAAPKPRKSRRKIDTCQTICVLEG